MRYEVQWEYQSSLGGPWWAGDVVELTEELAEAVNRDSPGVLQAEKGHVQRAPTTGRAVEAPPKDRMVRTKRAKAPAENVGVMTRDSFKAVKDK